MLPTSAEMKSTPNESSSSKTKARAKSGSSLCKCGLFCLSCVTLACGLALVFMGMARHNRDSALQVLVSESASGSYIDHGGIDKALGGVIVGVVCCAVAFIGINGAVRETFLSLLLLLLSLMTSAGLELTTAALAFTAKDGGLAGGSRVVTSNMKQSLQKYGEEGFQHITEVWDSVQLGYSCCGVDFAGDWSFSVWSRRLHERGRPLDELPSTCCANVATAIPNQPCYITSSLHHRSGCIGALRDSATASMVAVGTVAVVAVAAHAVMAAIAVRLMIAVKKPDPVKWANKIFAVFL